MTTIRFLFTTIALLALASLAHGDLKPTTLDKPLPVQVTLTEKSERVAGAVIRYDPETVVVKTGKGERELKWSQLTGPSQYMVRAQLIDKKSAADWLDLAELGMRYDLREQAKAAVNNAVRLDPASRLKGDAILRGQGAAAAAKPAKDAAPDPLGKPADAAAATSPDLFGKPATAKYEKSTLEQDAKAMAKARAVAASAGETLRIRLAEFETPHFIIFTDWDPREYQFLKDNCEGAYAAVSNQFDIPVKENVFIGKLPVLMFADHAVFNRYATTVDNFPVPATVAGYFTSHGDGTGHMVMWKPRAAGNATAAAERAWAYTLTHEFTHAFVSRYRSNRRVPRWLNEGLAEVIAYNQFPRPGAHAYARARAGEKFDFESLFDDQRMPGGAMYPVMQTMVEALIQEDKKAFLKMFDDIKDGVEPEEALKNNFKAGYKDWEPAWRRYAKNLRD
jgi:hypothetical protein